MTASNERSQNPMPANEPEIDEVIHLNEEDASEAAVPAAGGTFGVTDEDSGYGAASGAHPVNPAGDAAVAADDRIERARPMLPETGAEPSTVDAVVRDGNREVPAAGGTFGVTEDNSGYQAPGQRAFMPERAREQEMPGLPPNAGYAPATEGQFAPTQYGHAPAQAPVPQTVAYTALVLAVGALVALMFPGSAWIVGGVLGVGAIVAGVIGMRQSNRMLSMLATGGGAVAVALAVATLVVLLIV
ncbi:hypothetical protein [uncultured Gulosibacter sp.]|uniref:hypothetical protein n=1 Tax=uncultured Gulosibacter sp. TaxID=1339167 RepID=UPI0028894E01|nr:hypothetical protein [uncultured Gulosibacter sp.]